VARTVEMINQSEKEIISAYKDKVVSVVRYKLGNRNEDYKDVANDTLIAVLLSLREGRYDPSKGKSLEAYILGIAYNKIRDYYQSKSKQKALYVTSLEMDFISEDTPRLEQQEYRNFLTRMLGSLPSKYQHVLYLRYFETVSVHEISQQLNLEPHKVSERIHYGLTLLKKKCKKEKFFSIFFILGIIYYWTMFI
jgi:RNA polymerase sigma factor (sigma-70 family)